MTVSVEPLTVARWRKYGKDRLYVSASGGRKIGWVDLSTGGTRLDEPMVLERPLIGQWSERWGREATAHLLRQGLPFDGIAAGRDQIACGIASALRDNGLRVPNDVGRVGFDSWEVMVEASRPPLTTIDPNLTELGHATASALLDAIDGNAVTPGVRQLPCRLVTRRSTEID